MGTRASKGRMIRVGGVTTGVDRRKGQEVSSGRGSSPFWRIPEAEVEIVKNVVVVM